MRSMLDTYAVIELFIGSKKGEKVREMIEDSEGTYISSITIYEAGIFFRRKLEKEKADAYIRSISDHWKIISVDGDIARCAVDLKERFKLPTADCLIYACTRSVNAV
ncbi:MAG: PIN domain-containing protein, partial [Candidatus Thermoplasmatota archaeon]|nr:PIN domain-containing protein [Candidatus Thermoplasmatota archaeon]